MKLRKLGNNETELKLNNNITVLFSYSTPVAAFVNNKAVKTSKFWSVTTSKHINKWLEGRLPALVDQDFLDNLIKE